MKIWLCAILPAVIVGGLCGADLDRDGIPDDWETNGVTVTFADGHTRFLDLRAQGASPGHKDIIVWINWMEASDHTHRPTANTSKAAGGSAGPIEAEALGRIKAAFRSASGFQSGAGSKGINLIGFY